MEKKLWLPVFQVIANCTESKSFFWAQFICEAMGWTLDIFPNHGSRHLPPDFSITIDNLVIYFDAKSEEGSPSRKQIEMSYTQLIILMRNLHKVTILENGIERNPMSLTEFGINVLGVDPKTQKLSEEYAWEKFYEARKANQE